MDRLWIACEKFVSAFDSWSGLSGVATLRFFPPPVPFSLLLSRSTVLERFLCSCSWSGWVARDPPLIWWSGTLLRLYGYHEESSRLLISQLVQICWWRYSCRQLSKRLVYIFPNLTLHLNLSIEQLKFVTFYTLIRKCCFRECAVGICQVLLQLSKSMVSTHEILD